MVVDQEFFDQLLIELNEVKDKLLLFQKQGEVDLYLTQPDLGRLIPVEELKNSRIMFRCKSCGLWSSQAPGAHLSSCTHYQA